MKEIEVMVTETTREQRKITIQLPIYRRQVTGDYSTIYTKINEDLSAIHITDTCQSWDDCYSDGYTVEYEAKYDFDHSNSDYHLGRGEYALAPQEFSKVVHEMWGFIRRLCPENGTVS